MRVLVAAVMVAVVEVVLGFVVFAVSETLPQHGRRRR
jgi:hypothetical protein